MTPWSRALSFSPRVPAGKPSWDASFSTASASSASYSSRKRTSGARKEAKEPWAFLPGEIWNQSEYMTAWGLEMMMVSGCRAAISRATRV